MSRAARLGLVVALAAAAAPRVAADDRPAMGAAFELLDPAPTDTSRRKLHFSVEDVASAPLSGDPTEPPSSAGGMLQVFVEGATPSSQTFTLPRGRDRVRKPFWQAIGAAGFGYADRRGEQGPVESLRLRTADGTLQIKGRLRGAGLDVVPPDPGTRAFVTLALGGGDRYCVQFGPEGIVRNDGARAFSVRKPTQTGCPALVSGEFLALSYNVAGLPEGISGSHPAVNTPLIAPLLNGYDLVLVQESWKTPDPNPFAPTRVYHEILEAGSLHPFHSLSAPLPFGTDPRRPSALVSDGLNQFSRFPFEDVVRVPWDGCHPSAADCLSLKGFGVARTTFAPGATVDVYDLHMEAGGDPEDDTLRDQGVTQLATFMATFSAGRPVIVGGDFNLHTDVEPDASQFQRLLAGTGLQDVCAALACPEPGRIDKFLFRSNDAVTITPLSWRFETDVFRSDDGEPLSDHDALAVRFAWTVSGG